LVYYYKSLMIEQKLNNQEGVLYALYGISGVEGRLGHIDNAKKMISNALNIALMLKNPKEISICYIELGKMYLSQNLFELAISKFDSGYQYTINSFNKREQAELFRELSRAYNSLNNYSQAYHYLNSFVSLNDSLNNSDINSRVVDLERKFQIRQKDKEIEHLLVVNELKTENYQAEKRNRIFLLVTVLMVIFLSIFNIRRIAPDLKSIVEISLGVFFILILISAIVFLFYNEKNFSVFLDIFKDIFIYSAPVIFLGFFLLEKHLLKQYLEKARNYTHEIEEIIKSEQTDENISLTFEGKNAEFEYKCSDILCFEANDNYIAIYYLKRGIVKKELYRSTMKQLESQLVNYKSFIRCHKSYIINSLNIHHISGNSQGYKIHLNLFETEIPVSRKFPKSMIDQLKKRD